MPLPRYGVLVGTLNRFVREDPIPGHFGSWYHGMIYVRSPAGEYECAVDVSTPAGINIRYRVITRVDPRLIQPVLSLSAGWHRLPSTPMSGALDYIRAPLFQIRLPWAPAWLRSTLQRLLSRWILSDGSNALDVLEAHLKEARRVLVFGDGYSEGLGVHDVHMNQGDPPGSQWFQSNATWQDGGTIIEKADGSLVAVITKFEPQSLTTDDAGHPV